MRAAALLVDWVGVWLTSRQGSWRLRSAGHWTERHGNFVILALGESLVAIGVGAAQRPISTPILFGAVLGVAAAVLAPLAGLAGLVLVLAALIVVETTRYAQTRRSLRNTQPGERQER